jgi:hypothetical protein
LGNGNVLGNVFTDKENPFTKDAPGAMEKVQKLASEGKLYLRDKGRSRHFHQVKMEGDALQLGDQHEMKLSNRNIDPVLGGLMWLSRGYFKWLGLERISNWFDERLKRRDAISELNKQYKEEYKAMTDGEKKELKALRKHEKNLKKLEKIQKEAEKTQKELDEARGIDTTKTKGEMDSPLNHPPKVETKTNTMQPTRLGDEPVQATKPVRQTWGSDLVPERRAEEELPGVKKETPQKRNQIIIEGRELTEENINEFPPHVVEAFKIIQQQIIEKHASENTNQQPVTQQPEDIAENQALETQPEEPRPQENQPVVEEPAKTESVLLDLEGFQQSAANNGEVPTFDFVGAVDPAPTLQDRLAEEKQAMDNVKNWRDLLANSLFSHEEAKPTMDYYQTIKDKPNIRSEFVSGAVFGVLMKSAENPEIQQPVLSSLLSGKPLGSDKNDLLRDGMSAFNNALAQKTNGNDEPLADMLANTIKVLSRQSNRETNLSARHAMIGRLLANAARIADSYDLAVPLTQEELDLARGAKTMSDIAKGYLAARQYLGKEPMDIASEQGRKAVNKLLTGAFVEKMIQQDQAAGQTITNTQMLMGKSIWTAKNLEEMTGHCAARRAMDQEQLQAILETPNSLRTHAIAKRISDDVITESMGLQKQDTKSAQKEMTMKQQEKQFNLLQFPG